MPRWSPSPPCQPGRFESRAFLSQLAQVSGKLGQVPWTEPGGPQSPSPRRRLQPPRRPSRPRQAARILPSSFPGIPGLRAVPAVAVAGDVPHGHPVPSMNSSGHIPEVLVGQVPLPGCILYPRHSAGDVSPRFQGQGISWGPAPLPHSALCRVCPGLPRGAWGHGAARGHRACPHLPESSRGGGPGPLPAPALLTGLTFKIQEKMRTVF